MRFRTMILSALVLIGGAVALAQSGPQPIKPVPFALDAGVPFPLPMTIGSCSYEVYDGDQDAGLYWSVGTATTGKPSSSNGAGWVLPGGFKDFNGVVYQSGAVGNQIWVTSAVNEASGVVTWNGMCP